MSAKASLLFEAVALLRRELPGVIRYRDWRGEREHLQPVSGSYHGNRDEIDYWVDLIRRVESVVGRPHDDARTWVNEIIDGKRDL